MSKCLQFLQFGRNKMDTCETSHPSWSFASKWQQTSYWQSVVLHLAPQNCALHLLCVPKSLWFLLWMCSCWRQEPHDAEMAYQASFPKRLLKVAKCMFLWIKKIRLEKWDSPGKKRPWKEDMKSRYWKGDEKVNLENELTSMSLNTWWFYTSTKLNRG